MKKETPTQMFYEFLQNFSEELFRRTPEELLFLYSEPVLSH